MPRPPLPIGSWGQISTWVTQTDDNGKPVKHKSQAKFRDHDGHVRPVSAYGKTKTAGQRPGQVDDHDIEEKVLRTAPP